MKTTSSSSQVLVKNAVWHSMYLNPLEWCFGQPDVLTIITPNRVVLAHIRPMKFLRENPTHMACWHEMAYVFLKDSRSQPQAQLDNLVRELRHTVKCFAKSRLRNRKKTEFQRYHYGSNSRELVIILNGASSVTPRIEKSIREELQKECP